MDINNLWSNYDLNSKKQNSRCLAVNTILEGKYLVGPVLGQGGFGITYVGYDLNMESKIAIKEYFPVELVSRDTTTMHGDRVLSLSGEKSVTYKAGLKKYVAEAQNVSQFSEVPGVVSVKDFFYANETAYIVMEYIDGISLKDYLKEKGGRLTEEETLKIMKPVLEALVQVHKSGIIHRDISPDNIMLTFEGSGHNKIQSVKLIDFGAARMTAKNDQKSLTIILKHGYAPEEQYRTHGEQGPWTDVYALCAVLYRMVTGETPVPAMDRMFQDELKTFDKFNAKVSANTAAAILKGLAVKKDDRIQSVQELIGALYEGAKIKGSGKRSNQANSKQTYAIAAGAAVVVLAGALVLGSGVLSGKKDAEAGGLNAVGSTAGEHANADNADPNNIGTNIENENVTEEVAVRQEIVENGYKRTMVSGDFMKMLVREDGTVYAQGVLESALEEVADWVGVCSVTGGNNFCMALRTDGTVLVVDESNMGIANAEQWKDVISIDASYNHAIGLCLDGSVVSVGSNNCGQCEVSHWTDMQAVGANNQITVGVKKDGTVLLTGKEQAILRGEKEGDAGEKVIGEGWTDIVQIEVATNYVYGLQEDGTVLCINFGGEVYEEPAEDFRAAAASWEPIARLCDCSNLQPNVVGITKNGKIVAGIGYIDRVAESYLSAWTDIVEVEEFGYWRILAKKSDGTYISTPVEDFGNTKISMKNLQYVGGADGFLAGLDQNGDLLVYGTGDGDRIMEYVDNWKRLSQLSVSNNPELHLSAITQEGKCIFFGGNDDLVDHYGTEEAILIGGKKAIQVSEGSGHRAVLLEDGTVEAWGYSDRIGTDPATGKTESGSCDVDGWKNVVEILAADDCTLGLTKDGTLLATGEYPKEILEWKNVEFLTADTGLGTAFAAIDTDGKILLFKRPQIIDHGQTNIVGWDGQMKALALSSTHTVGLCHDGTVKAVGNNASGQCEVDEWTNIQYIYAFDNCTLGITESGELKIAGLYDSREWIMENTAGSKDDSEIGSVSFETEEEIGEQIAFYNPQNSIARCRFGSHMLFCEENGNVVARGSDEYGQCDVDMWDHVVQVAAGSAHSLGLRSDGTVFAAGSNHAGQCDVETWKNVVKIKAGENLSLGVTEEGTILLAGQRLYDEDLGVVSSWTDIKAVDYEPFEGVVIGLKTDGTVLTEGGAIDASHVTGWQNVEDILYESGQLIGKEADGTLRLSMLEGEDPHSIYFEEMEPMRYFNDRSSIAVTEDGTVKALRDSGSWNYTDILGRIERGLTGWNAANIDYNGCFYGITEDGTFYEQYLNRYGNSEPEEFVDLNTVHVVMSINDYPNLIGQTESGKLLHYGEAQELRRFCDKYSFTTPIKQILLKRGVICLLEDGTLVAEQSWIPKKNVSKMIYLEGQSYMAFLMKDGTVEIHNPYEEEDTPEDVKNAVKSWSHMRDIWECGGRVYGVCEDGSIICANHESHPFMNTEITAEMMPYFNHYNIFAVTGDGEIEILNLDGDSANQSGRYQIDGWSGIAALAMGESHTVGLRTDGTVVATGSNHCGQCDVEDWKNVVAIDAGGQCTIGLTADGQMLMAGSMN